MKHKSPRLDCPFFRILGPSDFDQKRYEDCKAKLLEFDKKLKENKVRTLFQSKPYALTLLPE